MSGINYDSNTNTQYLMKVMSMIQMFIVMVSMRVIIVHFIMVMPLIQTIHVPIMDGY